MREAHEVVLSLLFRTIFLPSPGDRLLMRSSTRISSLKTASRQLSGNTWAARRLVRSPFSGENPEASDHRAIPNARHLQFS